MARAHLILDRYEPIGTAGSGGFGTVQIAWDPRIQRKVAIKTIQLTEQDAYRAALPGAQAVAQRESANAGQASNASPTADRWHGVQPWSEFLAGEPAYPDEYADDFDEDEASGAFEPETFHALANLPGLDEARTAAMLADPRIVTVYDFEVRGRMAYLIMEYVEGATLTKILREYADWLTLDVVAAVFDAVAGALVAAHDAGVLHLDIKPDNILVNAKGEVKVTDFGLATLADASGAGTTGGGTIGYMPLEQMRREHLDARADEWSLAAVTYEMLTGENPFLAKGLDAAAAAIEDAELVLPSLCWENLDEQIDDVLFYALDPDREERYSGVADFAEEAQKFLGDVAAGKDQLADIVEDALGLAPEPEPEAESEGEGGFQRAGSGIGLFGLMKALFAGGSADGAGDDAGGARNAAPIDYPDDGFDDFESESEQDAEPAEPKRRSARPRKSLRELPGKNARGFMARAFAAVASACVAALAAVNFTVLEAFGAGRIAVAVALVIAAAGLAVVRPHIGALVSFAALAVALVMNGAPIPAIVLLVALVAWWYFIARESTASSNVALASPLLGAVGAASAVPLLAGRALRPVQAIATTALAAVNAVVLGSLGSVTMLGWDAPAHWLIGHTDVAGLFLELITRPSTWLVVAGWLAATFVQSLLSASGKRGMQIAGMIAALVIVAASTAAILGPSVQLVVSLLVGFAALLVVTI